MRSPSAPPRTLLSGVAVAVAAMIALAACAGDEQPAATDAPEDAQETDEAPDADATDGTEDAVEVTLVDYAFEGLPDTVPAGTRFTIDNQSASELHELVAVRLPDDEGRSVAELAELPPDELVEALGDGEPDTVLLAEPGGPELAAVGDGTLNEPGRYAVMCFIPTGADPQEYLEAAAEATDEPPQVEGGPPHYMQGMYDEVVVDA